MPCFPCCNEDDDDDNGNCCSVFKNGRDDEKRMMVFVLLDLSFWLIVPGLLVIQLFKCAARLDEIRTHTPYEVPSTTSWYDTFWPLYTLYAFFLFLIVMWFIFITQIGAKARRIWLTFMLLGFILITALSFASTVMLCENANAITHNYVIKALKKHNVTKAILIEHEDHKTNITEEPIKLWDDDDLFQVFNDPFALQNVQYSWLQVMFPIIIFLIVIMLTGFVNWGTQNSQKVNVMTLFCADSAGDVETISGFLGDDDKET